MATVGFAVGCEGTRGSGARSVGETSSRGPGAAGSAVKKAAKEVAVGFHPSSEGN